MRIRARDTICEVSAISGRSFSFLKAKTVASDSGFASGDWYRKPRPGLWAKVRMIDSDNCALLLAISNSDDLHGPDMFMRARDAIFEVSAPRGRFSFLNPRKATSFS
jgi:hypothetical protein